MTSLCYQSTNDHDFYPQNEATCPFEGGGGGSLGKNHSSRMGQWEKNIISAI